MLKTNKTIRSPYTTLAAGLAVSGLLFAGVAGAATDTANMAVSATVTNNCTITTAPLAFGTYDPVDTNLATPKTGSGHVFVTCTSGANATVTLDDGVNGDTGSTDAAPLRRLVNGLAFLDYALFSNGGLTTAWASDTTNDVAHVGDGTETDLEVFGQIPAAQQVVAGSYTDTVVATVTF
jgi:spore coat protein U-like protein